MSAAFGASFGTSDARFIEKTNLLSETRKVVRVFSIPDKNGYGVEMLKNTNILVGELIWEIAHFLERKTP